MRTITALTPAALAARGTPGQALHINDDGTDIEGRDASGGGGGTSWSTVAQMIKSVNGTTAMSWTADDNTSLSATSGCSARNQAPTSLGFMASTWQAIHVSTTGEGYVGAEGAAGPMLVSSRTTRMVIPMPTHNLAVAEWCRVDFGRPLSGKTPTSGFYDAMGVLIEAIDPSASPVMYRAKLHAFRVGSDVDPTKTATVTVVDSDTNEVTWHYNRATSAYEVITAVLTRHHNASGSDRLTLEVYFDSELQGSAEIDDANVVPLITAGNSNRSLLSFRVARTDAGNTGSGFWFLTGQTRMEAAS